MTDHAPVLALLRTAPGDRPYGGMRLSLDSLRSLRDLGHRVRYVAPGRCAYAHREEADGIAGWVVPYSTFRHRLRPGVPYQVAKRLPAERSLTTLIGAVRDAFSEKSPVLLLEQFPMLAWFTALSSALPRSPRVLREHNDEPRYAAIVAAHARGAARAMAVREVRLVSALYHDRRFLDAFDLVTSISEDDDVARYRFGAQMTVVPAFLAAPDQARPTTDPRYDFGVFGSLDHGPNAAAVQRLLTTVWPDVRATRQLRLLVAGHAPSRTMSELIARTRGAELLADPGEQRDVYDLCGAMVDPAVDGTGVAVKTLEALTFGKRAFGYAAARRGLPADLRRFVVIASTPAELSAALVAADASPTGEPMAAVAHARARDAAALSKLLDGVAHGA